MLSSLLQKGSLCRDPKQQLERELEQIYNTADFETASAFISCHKQYIGEAKRRLKSKLTSTTIAKHFLSDPNRFNSSATHSFKKTINTSRDSITNI